MVLEVTDANFDNEVLRSNPVLHPNHFDTTIELNGQLVHYQGEPLARRSVWRKELNDVMNSKQTSIRIGGTPTMCVFRNGEVMLGTTMLGYKPRMELVKALDFVLEACNGSS